MTPLTLEQYLDTFTNYENSLGSLGSKDFSLDRIKSFLEVLGNPQKKLKCFHVAGSKGKGSVCAFLSSILNCAGYKVGLYSSPHMYDVKERIRILSSDIGELFPGCITETDALKIVKKIETARKDFREPLTYFEMLTVIAFCYFADAQVDYVVLETGLGGRLDATNVTDSIVCALTSIGMEHVNILGNDIVSIANEKLGILKQDGKLVVAPQWKEVVVAVEEHVRNKNAVVEYIDEACIKVKDESLDGQTFIFSGYELNSSLLGRYQRINAATAISMIKLSGVDVNSSAVCDGVSKAIWPGRFEVLQKKPYVILDSAHTVDSSRELCSMIVRFFPENEVRIVLGFSEDKDAQGMIENFSAIASTIVLTQSSHERSADLSSFNEEGSQWVPTVSDAISQIFDGAQKDDIILVSGSIFLVSEAREIISKIATP